MFHNKFQKRMDGSEKRVGFYVKIFNSPNKIMT